MHGLLWCMPLLRMSMAQIYKKSEAVITAQNCLWSRTPKSFKFITERGQYIPGRIAVRGYQLIAT